MPTPADAPLRKVTLNLYDLDVETLERQYGHGWSTHVRDMLHRHANVLRQWKPQKTQTLGDLDG